MMGLGYLGGGGPSSSSSSSSSSSHLSALAPPFTVYRFNSKPTTNPQLLQFSDSPYAPSSYGHPWQYVNPAAPPPRSSELDVDSVRITSIPLPSDYPLGYSVSQPSNPDSTRWSALNTGAKTSNHGFLYDAKVEPYYPPYVSPRADDSSAPLMALSDSSYDMSTSLGLVSPGLSSQVDYTQSLSGLEYTPHWAGVWDGLVDSKRGKQSELDGSFSLGKTNAAHDSHAYNNYVNQVERGIMLEEGPRISSGEFSDAMGRDSNSGFGRMEPVDNISLLAQKDLSFPFDSSKMTIRSSSFTIPENFPPGPCMQSPKNFASYQHPYNPYDQCIRPLNSCLSDPIAVTKSSPALVIRPPPIGTVSTPQKTVSRKCFDIVNVNSVHQSEGLVNNIPLKEKDPPVLKNPEGEEGSSVAGQLKPQKVISEQLISLSSSIVEEPSGKLQSKDTLNNVLTVKSGCQVSRIDIKDGFSLSDDSVEGIESSENFADCLDHPSTAVDSPCWKGAPAFHLSPFDVDESETAHHFMKNLDECCNLDVKVDQTFRPLSDSIRSPRKKSGEEDRVEHEFGCTIREQGYAETAKARLKSLLLTSSKGVQFCEESIKPGEDYNLPKFSGTKQLGVEGDNFTTTKLNLEAAIVDNVVNMNDTTEGRDIAVHAAENVLCSPSSEEGAIEQPKPCRNESAPTLDVPTLINSMKNLSQLLLYNCSSDLCALKEQDLEALKDVISNLDALVSKKMVDMTWSQEPPLPQQVTCDKVGESLDHYMRMDAGTPKFENNAAQKLHSQLDYQKIHEEKGSQNVSGEKTESLQHFFPFTNDLDILGDDNMAQAIRKVLNENFSFGEEIQSQALLFKNLWLEAEAKLCSISYKARFERMKIEMETFMSNQTKENAASSAKSSSVKNLHDLSTSAGLSTNAEVGSMEKSIIQSSPSNGDDVEASVLARLHILKCRDDPKSLNVVGQEEDTVPAVSTSKMSFIGDVPVDIGGSGYDSVKDFLSLTTDDLVIQSSGNSGQRNQYSLGSNDNSSCDWEHVLKDDISWH